MIINSAAVRCGVPLVISGGRPHDGHSEWHDQLRFARRGLGAAVRADARLLSSGRMSPWRAAAFLS
jgi:hypothetical protein